MCNGDPDARTKMWVVHFPDNMIIREQKISNYSGNYYGRAYAYRGNINQASSGSWNETKGYYQMINPSRVCVYNGFRANGFWTIRPANGTIGGCSTDSLEWYGERYLKGMLYIDEMINEGSYNWISYHIQFNERSYVYNHNFGTGMNILTSNNLGWKQSCFTCLLGNGFSVSREP